MGDELFASAGSGGAKPAGKPGRRRAETGKRLSAPGGGPVVLTVGQLTQMVERAVVSGVPAMVHVRGEVSNLTVHGASGHVYFTLKDSAASLRCAMWRDVASKLKFKMAHGMEVIASGRIAVYAPQGDYRLYARSINPVGQGALELAFAQLKARLDAMGLFAPERKKPLPAYPIRLVMVTSRQTAALQDMLKVLRRFPWLRLWVYHVPVQGEGAAAAIAAGITHLNSLAASELHIDAILLARGGGSLEDLWAFNEEPVALAIAASRLPIVTGIGHEVDVSIADLVADYHAHTPTEAAQVVTSHWRTARDAIELAGTRLRSGVRSIIQEMRQRLTGIERHPIFRRPTDRIDAMRQLLDDRQRALSMAVGKRLHQAERRLETAAAKFEQRHPRHQIRLRTTELSAAHARLHRAWTSTRDRLRNRIDALASHLQAIGPRQVLARGYSITTVKKTSRILRAAADAPPGTAIVTQLADGTVESVTRDAAQGRLFEE